MSYPAGQCRDCGDTPGPGRSRCATCRARRREADAAQRDERRRRKLCQTCGAKAVKGRSLCARHLEYYADRDRARRETG